MLLYTDSRFAVGHNMVATFWAGQNPNPAEVAWNKYDILFHHFIISSFYYLKSSSPPPPCEVRIYVCFHKLILERWLVIELLLKWE